MAEFKRMVKMATTEPSVVLKLKKGGCVMKKAAGGGTLDALAASRSDERMPPSVTSGAPMSGAAPARPSLAARRRAMMGKKGMAAPVMAKKGGDVAKVEKELKAHEKKPASKAHAGLKTGGVVKGQCGYKTGGVVNGQGGYKKGGAVKKFAKGGQVLQDDGRPEKMPQGKKKPSPPVSVTALAGTFKKGGKVEKKADGGAPVTQSASTEKQRVEISAPTPEELKRLRSTYDPAARMEQKAAEEWQKRRVR